MLRPRRRTNLFGLILAVSGTVLFGRSSRSVRRVLFRRRVAVAVAVTAVMIMAAVVAVAATVMAVIVFTTVAAVVVAVHRFGHAERKPGKALLLISDRWLEVIPTELVTEESHCSIFHAIFLSLNRSC